MTDARLRPAQALVAPALSKTPIRSAGLHGEAPTSTTPIELTYPERKCLEAIGGTAPAALAIAALPAGDDPRP